MKRSKRPHLSTTKLEALVEEATVDCYNEDEERVGFLTMIEEHLALPFETAVLGVPVLVERVEIGDTGDILAHCRRGRQRQRIPLVDLLLPAPPPKGAEWIDAYRHWLRRGTR